MLQLTAATDAEMGARWALAVRAWLDNRLHPTRLIQRHHLAGQNAWQIMVLALPVTDAIPGLAQVINGDGGGHIRTSSPVQTSFGRMHTAHSENGQRRKQASVERSLEK